MKDHGSEDRRDGRTLAYEAPAVEQRAPISAPLNTLAQTLRPPSPRWRPADSE
jgi:hypothetical protein